MQDGVLYHWTPGDGLSLTPAANKRTGPPWNVDIAKEDAAGGHTQERHVGLSDSQFVAAVKSKDFSTGNQEFYNATPVGTFNMLAEANAYTNDVLNSNPDVVNAVAEGDQPRAFLQKRYTEPTGREALRSYRLFGVGGIVLHPTYSVGVEIRSNSSANGFFVRSAYAMNKRSNED